MLTAYKISPCVVAICLILSCSSPDKQEINLLLDKRLSAFELKDSDMYSECIHENYRVIKREELYDKARLVSRFEEQVSIINSVSFGKSERYIYIDGTDAKVMLLSSIDIEIEGYSMSYKAKEVLHLSKVLGRWRITKESMLNLLSGTLIFGD